MFVCSQQQLVGSPSDDLLCNTCVSVLTATVGKLQFTCSAPDMCVFSNQPLTLGLKPSMDCFCRHVCVCAHSSNWSAKVVECSEPSLGLLIGFLCKTHVCVGSSDLSAHPQLTSCATHVCMCSQQSVCQRVSIGLFSTRHVCIEKHTHVCAHSSNWSASP